MSTDKLQALLSRCKCSVSIEVNRHRDAYETAEQAMQEAEENGWLPDIEPEVRAKMVELNTVVELQFYPDTPIGFYVIWHYDLDAALDAALSVLS